MDVKILAKEIIEGKRLSRRDDLRFFLNCDLTALCAGADLLRQHFCGEKVDLCTIINGKSGRCSEDCKYCAQSAHHHTECEVYGFLDTESIVQAALANEKEGVARFSIVTSGRTLNQQDFEKALNVYRALKKACKLSLCASHGFLTAEQFRRLRESGVQRYHANIETSRRYFPFICSTHTYDQKIETIRLAQKEGFSVCSGGIIGMGETWEDRLDMAVSLAELGILSIPINALTPISGTPLEHLNPLTEEDILRTIALFRYINPTAHIRLAAGRKLMKHSGSAAFQSGASAAITGNMLTTTGATLSGDKRMLTELGRDVLPDYYNA
ncbi:MAG: biotin synthase BioB [Clostridia bacterium]|nr:biotin synthase BioB [Clostridia bacterium]